MILESPGTSPSVIAHAHGFSAVEVTELLPIFLDNLRADFSSADAPALVPPAPQPGDTPEEHADRYLRELAQNGHLDVVGYDTLAAGDELDGDLDTGDLDTDLDDLDDLDQDPTLLDAPDETPSVELAAIVELDEAAGPVGLPDADPHEPDLVADDPFAAAPPETDDSFDNGVAGDGTPAGADDPGEPFAVS
jgi:hypothetical protein